MKKTFTASILSLLIFFVLGTVLVYAQNIDNTNQPNINNTNQPNINNTNTQSFKIENPFRGGNTLYDLLKTVINDIILPIGGVLAVLAFIYSGFLYVMAQGNETKLKTAHTALLYTSIGTAVLLGSWTLANVIENTIDKLK